VNCQNTPISFLGGDRRTVEAARWLTERKKPTCVFGFEASSVPAGIEQTSNIERLVSHARALVLPVPGPDECGWVAPLHGTPVQIDRTLLGRLPAGSPVITGWAGAFLTAEAAATGARVCELMARDDFALYNAVPTSEGAILAAIKHSDITIAHSNCHVVGYGRCGKVQAEQLRGLQAVVTIVSRNTSSRAEAEALGYQVCELEQWRSIIDQANFIFNTVPALVLPGRLLDRTSREVLILDVASSPGGVDFARAQELGRAALLLPGLPGKTAPKTAGIALARTIVAILKEHENYDPGGEP